MLIVLVLRHQRELKNLYVYRTKTKPKPGPYFDPNIVKKKRAHDINNLQLSLQEGYAGKPKGIYEVLRERGLYIVKGCVPEKQ